MYEIDIPESDGSLEASRSEPYKVDDLTMIYGVTRGILFKKKSFEGEKVRDNVEDFRGYFLDNGHGDLRISSYMFEIEYNDRTSVFVKDEGSDRVSVIDKDKKSNKVGHYDHHSALYESPEVCTFDDIKDLVEFDGAKIKEMQIKFDVADGYIHGTSEVHEHSYMNEAVLGIVELEAAGIAALTGNVVLGGALAIDGARRIYNTYSKNQKLYLQFEETDDREVAEMQQRVRDDLEKDKMKNLFLNSV
ncbi:MAG: hypothetical protein QGG50_01670 [Methanopyri archaeon]|nr:hypothetical protein [Methanopyri archaeon]